MTTDGPVMMEYTNGRKEKMPVAMMVPMPRRA